MTRAPFGTLASGDRVERLTIAAGDLTASVLTLGAILQDVRLAGRPLTLGSDSLADYERDMRFFGPVVGPVANRIAGAEAEIDGRTCRFPATEGPNTLHGGPLGTHARLWEVVAQGAARLTLRLRLPDSAEGFPGNRTFTARFEAEAPATLRLTLTAETDAPTLVNLTNHSYWQMGEAGAPQTFRAAAARRVALDSAKIPTGETPAVEGTAFDFRSGRAVGRGAYDLCLILADARRALTPVATLTGGSLALDLATTEPGLQIYDGAAPGALALEAQNWPGATHHPHFPTDLLRPGEVRAQVTEWRFRRA